MANDTPLVSKDEEKNGMTSSPLVSAAARSDTPCASSLPHDSPLRLELLAPFLTTASSPLGTRYFVPSSAGVLPPFSAVAFHSANFGPPFPRDGVKDSPKVELEEKDLWEKFHRLGNEMMITESGRRIFPSIRVKLSGLDKEAKYYVIMTVLNAMHKYRPRIHIVRSDDIYSMEVANWTMAHFPETEFIAVTAYQNNSANCRSSLLISKL